MNGLQLNPSLGMGLSTTQPQGSDPHLDKWIDSILAKNTHMNFVDRITRPELYPTMPWEGGIATHRMAWDFINGKPAVYPTIIFDPTNQTLKHLSDEDAYAYAKKSKEFIPFDLEEDADRFSQQYKRHWRDGKGPIGY